MSTLLEYKLDSELTSVSCHVADVGVVRGLTEACSGVDCKTLKEGGGPYLSACWNFFGVDCGSAARCDIICGAEGSEPRV